MIRVFVAVDISNKAREELDRFIEVVRKKKWSVRWEVVEKLHVTLFFVGWVDSSKINSIKKAVEKGMVGFRPFSIKLGKLQAFPSFYEPRVVWVGIRGDQQELVRLQKNVSKELTGVGFEEEKRGWIPHLTIGRVKKDLRFRARKELGRQLKKIEVDEFEKETLVNRVVVYESKLQQSSSEYVSLYEAWLN